MSTIQDGFTSFEQVDGLDDDRFDEVLSLFAPDEDNQAIDLWPERIRRRRRLLRPALQIAKLDAGGKFIAPVRGTEEKTLHNVDIFLSRCHIAESLSDQFDAQVQIGVEHEFDGGEIAQILHTRTEVAAGHQDLPIFNLTFAQNLRVTPGANFLIRLMHVESRSGKTIRNLMNTEIFKDGVKAATKFNPIFGMATKAIDTLTAILLENEKNRVITGTTIGFFGSQTRLGYDLSTGDYLFAQLPADLVGCINDGSLTMPNPHGQVLLKNEPLDANYLLVSIQPSLVPKVDEVEVTAANPADSKPVGPPDEKPEAPKDKKTKSGRTA